MKLSTRSRYGVRMMATLALHHGEGPVLLREISERERISEKYLSQIVIPLRTAALLRSVRGARGGYVLAREPGQITLCEIVEVLEGGLDLANGEQHATPTARVVRGVWTELARQMARSLSEITLEEIAHRIVEGGEHPVMYNI